MAKRRTSRPVPKAPDGAAERRFLREAELAQRWGMSHRTLQRWRATGVGPVFHKFGRAVCYPLEGERGVLAFEAETQFLSTCERNPSEGGL